MSNTAPLVRKGGSTRNGLSHRLKAARKRGAAASHRIHEGGFVRVFDAVVECVLRALAAPVMVLSTLAIWLEGNRGNAWN